MTAMSVSLISPVSSGFKPHVAAELLNVGPESIRQWRSRLDQNPLRAYFSASSLLAYRIFKALIRNKYIPVSLLEKCCWAPLFEVCENVSWSSLSECWLIIYPHEGRILLIEEHPVLNPNTLDEHVLALAGIVKEHQIALEEYGCVRGRPRRQSLYVAESNQPSEHH